MSAIIIDSAKTVRQLVLQEVQGIPEEAFDIRPEGFNNTIRWNVGHMVYWMDAYMKLCFSAAGAIPEAYASLFNSGTKPADWTAAPPSKEELLGQLSCQLSALSELSPALMDVPLQPPLQYGPLVFRLAGELFNFGMMHEAMHLAVCSCLLKSVRANV